MFHITCDTDHHRAASVEIVEYVDAETATSEQPGDHPHHKRVKVDLSAPCARAEVDNNSGGVKEVVENWPSYKSEKRLSRNRARWTALDQIAANRLCSLGYEESKIYEILNSGYDYTEKRVGSERLYRFTTFGTNATEKSPYWLTKTDFENIKRECFISGKWDREKVKQRLAIPCTNRADCVIEAIVTVPHDAEYARIASCHEGLTYVMNSGDSYEYKNKPLAGGGYQTIPDRDDIRIVGKPIRLP